MKFFVGDYLLSFGSFLKEILSSGIFALGVIPSIAMMFINGWTDAPVSIASAVNSGAITLKNAAVLSAICNFSGAVFAALSGNLVAQNIIEISGFSSLSNHFANACFIAAFVSVGIWAVTALYFGIPTSESHALMSALAGASVAAAGFKTINLNEWCLVLLGLVVSTLPIIPISKYVASVLSRFAERHRITPKALKKAQVFGASLSSFAHGAQDGQKFAGIFAIQTALYLNHSTTDSIPLWTTGLSAFLISLGMLLGGGKIISSFSLISSKEPICGVAADVTSSIMLTVLSFLGIPASTTSVKTCSVLGAGRLTGNIKVKSAFPFFLAWTSTFPICALLGFFLAKILMRLL